MKHSKNGDKLGDPFQSRHPNIFQNAPSTKNAQAKILEYRRQHLYVLLDLTLRSHDKMTEDHFNVKYSHIRDCYNESMNLQVRAMSYKMTYKNFRKSTFASQGNAKHDVGLGHITAMRTILNF